MTPSRLLPAIVIATLAFLPSCATNPETGRRSLNVIPDATLNSMGVQAYQEVLSTEKVSTNARQTAVVKRVAERIAAASGEKFNWEVNLIESDQANAFVLPGGKIVVYTGILPICENEAGLAFVLGHEVGHAVARHGGERMTQTLGAQLTLAIADASGLGGPENHGTVMAAMGAGAQYGVLLPFSRAHESDADHMGIRYMSRAGYDPHVAPLLWQRMSAGGGQQPPEWMSTHPSHETRSTTLEGLIPEAMKFYDAAPTRYGLGEKL